eukprot:TRINITY_DN48779_c0_g1_i1.p1 TRINITY_DN48779_c0_g1~~TRINITY_DN48779_c0_g1_i1.p1  ORF type:complete len:349 (-),score=74.69 TRINITY_DN48779_c0_g1_i1:4-1005(-)
MPLVSPAKRVPYTIAEVAEHKTAASLWVIMNRKVYDVTAFHKRHPGGPNVLLQMGGKDATAAAAAAHKNVLPANLMWEFCIGYIVNVKPQETAPAQPAQKKAVATRKAVVDRGSDIGSTVSSASDAFDGEALPSKAKRRSPQAVIEDQENIANRPVFAVRRKQEKKEDESETDALGDSRRSTTERKITATKTLSMNSEGDTHILQDGEEGYAASEGQGLFSSFWRRITCWSSGDTARERSKSPTPYSMCSPTSPGTNVEAESLLIASRPSPSSPTLSQASKATLVTGVPSAPPGKDWVRYQDEAGGDFWWYYEGPEGKWWAQAEGQAPEPYTD